LPYASVSIEEATKLGQMGQLFTTSSLSSIFAESYGVWNWDGKNMNQVIKKIGISRKNFVQVILVQQMLTVL
jgi:hypothetical protein